MTALCSEMHSHVYNKKLKINNSQKKRIEIKNITTKKKILFFPFSPRICRSFLALEINIKFLSNVFLTYLCIL